MFRLPYEIEKEKYERSREFRFLKSLDEAVARYPVFFRIYMRNKGFPWKLIKIFKRKSIDNL